MNATEIVLSVLITVSGWYHDGLDALNKKEYAKAVTALSKVCEKADPSNIFRADAFYYRAMAHNGNKDKKSAAKDLLQYIDLTELESQKEGVRELYIKYGGDPLLLVPEVSPGQQISRYLLQKSNG